MVVSVSFNSVNAQSEQSQEEQKTKIIKGVVSDLDGPLEGVNVILKGSNQGTVTNSKGEFTFPQPLKTNDVLLFSFIGFETVSVKIKDDTTVIKLTLNEDLVEFIGEVNTNALYKSKRSKNKN
jgi:hypothetical protein